MNRVVAYFWVTFGFACFFALFFLGRIVQIFQGTLDPGQLPWPLLGILGGTLILAQHGVLSWGPKRKLDLTIGLNYALIIILGPATLGAPFIGLCWLVGQLLWLLRPGLWGQRRTFTVIASNTAQVFLASTAAGFIYQHTSGYLHLFATGLTLYLVNSFLVAGMVAYQTDMNVVRIWRRDRGWSLLVSAGAMALGLLLVRYYHDPLVLISILLPSVVIYLSVKKTEQATTAAQERDLFIQIAAHELRTPLTSLKGYVNILQRQFEKDPVRTKRAVLMIDNQINRICGLVNQLLDVVQVDQGTLTLIKEPVDLGRLAQDVCATLQLITPDYQLEVKAPDSLVIVLDRLRIEQVLYNLLSNAIKYAQGGEQIEIECQSLSTGIQIIVRDFGCGIPEHIRAHIFERYYQAPENRQVNGFGLGLYIAKEIVEAHGGGITCISPPVGGTEFRILLPGATS